MTAIQLKLFEETTEIDILKAELADVKARSENVRRGLFARHSELSRLYIELKEELESVKRNQVCQCLELSTS
jgi:hypothetical protein